MPTGCRRILADRKSHEKQVLELNCGSAGKFRVEMPCERAALLHNLQERIESAGFPSCMVTSACIALQILSAHWAVASHPFFS